METKQLAVLAVLFLMQILVGAEENGDDIPTTTVVGTKGKDIQLKCGWSTSSPKMVAWTDMVWNNHPGEQLIFNSSIHESKIDTEHLNQDQMEVNGNYELTIKNLLDGTEEDNEYGVSSSGDYFCYYMMKDGSWGKHKFKLNLAGAPECKGSVDLFDGESTELSCLVNYDGDMPSLQWYRNGQKIDEMMDRGELSYTAKAINIDGATYMEDKNIYTCRMNVSDVVEECSLTLSVKYAVRDIKITPTDDVIDLGTELRCTARGNPEPTIVFEPATSSVYTGRNFLAMTLDETLLNKITTVTCTANNSIRGEMKAIETETSFNVTLPKSDAVSGSAADTSASLTVFVLSTITSMLSATLASLS